jgi:acetate kinase
MSAILVINSGSSSFKYQLIEMDTEVVLASGLVERIGDPMGGARHTTAAGTIARELEILDHTAGFAAMLEAFAVNGPYLVGAAAPVAVGHRVVHGGKRFFEPTIVNDLVKINIQDLADLAPLHNPANLQGIEAAQKAFATVPHVVVFDTAFHQTLPAAAYLYAIDAELAEQHRIRRYGFHGTSHKFVSEAAATFLGTPLESTNTIVLHLGNGASACAVEGGRSIDTSMGMTPLEGLVMGTRSGDIDPAVLFHLHRKTGVDFEQLDEQLNRSSGMLGLTGRGDMRDVIAAADRGDEAAATGLAVYAHRLKHYVGAYYAQLGRVDAIVFTAGVGENTSLIRAQALAGLEALGIEIDESRNTSADRGPRLISTDASRVAVLVIPTNEELEIARQTLSVL